MSDFALFGSNLFGDPAKPVSRGPVTDAFIEPPFTTLDARSGHWQERKRAWIAVGIKGEKGRTCKGNNAWNDLSLNPRMAESNRKIAAVGDEPTIFDPVLCELAYRWFCPREGIVLDPFAGGSVRGIVAGLLGYRYFGSDISSEQCAANEIQSDEIMPPVRPLWTCGDSRDTLTDVPLSDLVFTCPPYGYLERYSDDPRDLSTLSWTAFTIAYRLILTRAVAKLKQNRFACIVVGNFRDENTGLYRDLVSETVDAMSSAGLGYYNEAVLLTSIGSASMRVTRQFNASRKLCKTHQNVLVFIKGDCRKAVAAITA